MRNMNANIVYDLPCYDVRSVLYSDQPAVYIMRYI